MIRPLRQILFRARSLVRAGLLVLSFVRQRGLRGLLAKIIHRQTNRAAAPPSSLPLTSSLPHTPSPLPGARLDVIYAIGYWAGEPKRYRVFNPASALIQAGYRVHLLDYSRIEEIERQGWQAKVLVLFRAPYDPLIGLDEVLAYARSKGMKIVFDIDDLIFDKALAPGIDGLQALSFWERWSFLADFDRRRKLLLRADMMIAPTEPLCRAARDLGRPAEVLRNALNPEQLTFAATLPRRPLEPQEIRIGYFSGSRTHQQDFRQCEAALLSILTRYPQTQFWLVGYLELGEHWRPFEARIKRIGFMSPVEMLRCLAEVDINIAPLEVENPFCEAKSELKFFEAGLVRVPTIASATEPYRQAIVDGESGFVATSEAEWEHALDLLIKESGVRQKMGQAAYDRALERFGPEAMTRRIVELFDLEPAEKRTGEGHE